MTIKKRLTMVPIAIAEATKVIPIRALIMRAWANWIFSGLSPAVSQL